MAKYTTIKTVTKTEGDKTVVQKTGPTPPYTNKYNLVSASNVTRIPKPVIAFHDEKRWIVTIDRENKELSWSPFRK